MNLLYLCIFGLILTFSCISCDHNPFKVVEWCESKQSFHIIVHFSNDIYEDFYLYPDGNVQYNKNMSNIKMFDRLVLPQTKQVHISSPAKDEDVSTLWKTEDLKVPDHTYTIVCNFEDKVVSGDGAPNYKAMNRRWYLSAAFGLSAALATYWVYHGTMRDIEKAEAKRKQELEEFLQQNDREVILKNRTLARLKIPNSKGPAVVESVSDVPLVVTSSVLNVKGPSLQLTSDALALGGLGLSFLLGCLVLV